MGEIKLKLSDETEKAFRRRAMERYGFAKGSISNAAEEAVKKWTLEIPNVKTTKDPVNGLRGLLKHVKKSSVELQHEIGKHRAERLRAHRR